MKAVGYLAGLTHWYSTSLQFTTFFNLTCYLAPMVERLCIHNLFPCSHMQQYRSSLHTASPTTGTLTPHHVNIKYHPDPGTIHGHAEILEVMRQSIETRKTTLVELALDLIQRLIAHRALTGRVYSINHRRDLAAGVKGKRRGGGGEEDDEDAGEESDVLPPQVCNLCSNVSLLHNDSTYKFSV